MTPLRQKMIRELELQRKSSRTVEAYVYAVQELATQSVLSDVPSLNRSPARGIVAGGKTLPCDRAGTLDKTC